MNVTGALASFMLYGAALLDAVRHRTRLGVLHVLRGPLAWSIALYLLAGACWLPVVGMQIRMRPDYSLSKESLYRRFYRFEVVEVGAHARALCCGSGTGA